LTPIAVLRETRLNRYTLNTLAAILEACGVHWEVAGSAGAQAARLRSAAGRGGRPLALYSFMTPELRGVAREVRLLRRAAPGALFLAGGAHPSADPEGTAALGFDHVFAGEAEQTLPAFLAAGARGETVIRDPEGGPEDLEAFPPFPASRHGPVELTRGCRYRCAFCAVWGRTVRHRSRASVLAGAEALLASGRPRVSFVTPDALSYGADLGELDRLLGDLVGLGVRPTLGTFPSEVRPDRVTPEAVALLRRHCGNRTLVMGAQSGSDAVLRRLGRGHTVEDVVRAARTARQGGFTPHVDVIFGLPGETPEDQKATAELSGRLRREWGARIHAHYFHPLPGTPLWSRDPAPLSDGARAFLLELRGLGAEDGCWQEQERWAWRIISWAEEGWIRTPRRRDPESEPGRAGAQTGGTRPSAADRASSNESCRAPLVATTSGSREEKAPPS
jgi:B12-binding domain/radical SAM domain protein